MKSKFFFAAIFFTSVSCFGKSVDSYVGAVIPPIPDGCIENSGGLFFGNDKAAYSVVNCRGSYRIWLQSLVGKNYKKSFWKILDEVLIPLENGNRKLLDIPYCKMEKEDGATVAAFGTWEKFSSGYYKAAHISQAWKLNDNTGKIEKIDPSLVSCEYEDQE